MIPLRKLPYKERLQNLNLYSLKYRRIRGDMIEVFKILHHMYDSSVAPELIRNTSATRGNKCKLLNHTFHYNLKKNLLLHVWNSLPDYVVDVKYVAVFKKRLDKFSADQNVMFDWTADITGTGDRSKYILESREVVNKDIIKSHICLHPFSSLQIADVFKVSVPVPLQAAT